MTRRWESSSGIEPKPVSFDLQKHAAEATVENILRAHTGIGRGPPENAQMTRRSSWLQRRQTTNQIVSPKRPANPAPSVKSCRSTVIGPVSAAAKFICFWASPMESR